MSRPRCLCCGKPLAKHTQTLEFRVPNNSARVISGIDASPRTKAEAQRYTNLEIVSVRRGLETIHSVGVWDGTSYGLSGEGLFCTGRCAQDYGIVAAKRALGRTS